MFDLCSKAGNGMLRSLLIPAALWHVRISKAMLELQPREAQEKKHVARAPTVRIC